MERSEGDDGSCDHRDVPVGLFFFIVDSIFNAAIMGPHGILAKWVDCSSRQNPESRTEWQMSWNNPQ